MAAYPLSAAPTVDVLPVILAILALLLLGVSLARRRVIILPVGLLLLAGEYLAVAAARWPALDPATPLYAGALLLLAEVSAWALEPQWSSRTDPDLGQRRALHVAVIVLGAIVLDAMLLFAATVSVGSTLLVTAAGVAAAVGCLVLIVVLARR